MADPTTDRRRWLRIARNAAVASIVAVALYGLVGHFVAPGVVRSIAEREIAAQLGRKATIAAVHIDPFRLALTVDDFRLYEPDGAKVAVTVRSLVADFSSASLFRRALVLDRLQIRDPSVRVVRVEPQRFSFSDIVDRLAAKPRSEAPFLFSVNNIELDGGSIDLDDRVTGRPHRVDALRIALPFLSNLPYETTIFVTPQFAATVDGSALALTGKAQPFSATREAALDVAVSDVDLTGYMDLSPTPLPFRLQSGKLAATLSLAFNAAARGSDGRTVRPSLTVAGRVGIAALDIADANGRSAITAKSVDVDIAKIDPFAADVAIERVAVAALHVDATRRADGSVDLADLFRVAGPPGAADDGGSASRSPKDREPARATTVRIGSLTIADGSARFVDLTTGTPTTTELRKVDLAADGVATRGSTPTTFRLSVVADDDATIDIAGSAVAERRQGTGSVAIKGFHVARAAPYVASMLAARIDDGRIDAQARYRIDASGPRITGAIDAIDVRVDGLKTSLGDERAATGVARAARARPTLVAAESIAVQGGSFHFERRAFVARSLALVAPVVSVRRDATGRLNFAAALVDAKPAATVPGTPLPAPAPTATPTPRTAGSAGAGSPPAPAGATVVVAPETVPPFSATIESLSIDRGDVTFEDLAGAAPVRIRAQPLSLTATNVGTAARATVPFALSTGVDARGRLAAKGTLAIDPFAVEATIDAAQVPVAWLAAYAGDRVNVRVETADLGTKGTVRVARGPAANGQPAGALSVAYRGSLDMTRVRVLDKATSEEFVQWKSLAVPLVDFRMPARDAPLALTLGTVSVSDFYARVIVNANGRLNLQDVVSAPGQRQSVTTPEAAPTAAPVAPAAAPGAASASAARAATGAADTVPGRPTTTGPSAPDAAKASVHVAGVALSRGRVGITDNFIRPNYSANLTGLEGRVSAIASDDPRPTDIQLTGRIDGDGSVDVRGKLDPFAPTRYTDISAEAKDIELTRLTPYAIKYAGYAIDRGKLSTTVRYHIEDGKLDAQNQLFLDQLTFGAKVESPTATKLPVLLAVALLKNARGEISVNLPVSGSLSDPEFSVGSVIGRVLVNLLTRAVSSPFSLIASAVGAAAGSAAELGYVEFRPGVSDMTDDGKRRVELLAKGLAERPALKLDIIGRYDPAADPDGLRRDHLLDRLKDVKASDLSSKSGDRVGRNDVTIEPAEYASYLARVYDDTKLPDKPRNVVGIAKSVPVAEMERLLLANVRLDENDPRWLAEARADVVRHYLEDTGKVAASRVFLVTPKLDATGIDDGKAATRVDFALR